MISTIAPSLGGSVREVWIAWKQLQEGCGPSGRRVPVGRIVGMGEFAWSADGKLQRIVGPMQMKDVTASEENEVADALAKGQLQIVLRGTWAFTPIGDRIQRLFTRPPAVPCRRTWMGRRLECECKYEGNGNESRGDDGGWAGNRGVRRATGN